MGDPSSFRIRGGANPHTRNAWGVRKSVDRRKAREQWHGLARLLGRLEVDVYVLPAREESPGMVFPANAGFVTRVFDPAPPSDKVFLLSQALPSRAAEKAVYRAFAERCGFR